MLTLPRRSDITVAPVAFSVAASATKASVTNSSGATVILVPVPGSRGPTGAAGNGAPVFGEVPSGSIDGVNELFTTAHPFQSASTSVFINGLRERLNIGYTETTSTSITFSQPPFIGAELVIDYLIQ